MQSTEKRYLLSVIVPIYNAEPYLEKCIHSIMNQTYHYIEIILVDDGSTDSSLSICKKYKDLDSRIEIIHQENAGVVKARKSGLQIAKGQYVTYVDSDDWIESNMFEEMMAYIGEKNADIVTSCCKRDYETYSIADYDMIPEGIYEGEKLRKVLASGLIDIETFYRTGISVYLWGKIFDVDLLKVYQSAVDDRISLGEDIACLLPCILNARKVVVTKRCMYHYCIRNNSMTSSPVEWESMEILFDFLNRKMMEHCDDVENIPVQFLFIKCFYILLKYPEKILQVNRRMFFPFGELRKEDKVIIYGKGRFGTQIASFLRREWGGAIVAWVDKGIPESMDDLARIEFDKIIIAVIKGSLVNQIFEELCNMGIEKNKILKISKELLGWTEKDTGLEVNF